MLRGVGAGKGTVVALVGVTVPAGRVLATGAPAGTTLAVGVPGEAANDAAKRTPASRAQYGGLIGGVNHATARLVPGWDARTVQPVSPPLRFLGKLGGPGRLDVARRCGGLQSTLVTVSARSEAAGGSTGLLRPDRCRLRL